MLCENLSDLPSECSKTVLCTAGVYFVSVVILCGMSLAASTVVMYIHNCSSADESALAMNPRVSISTLRLCRTSHDVRQRRRD